MKISCIYHFYFYEKNVIHRNESTQTHCCIDLITIKIKSVIRLIIFFIIIIIVVNKTNHEKYNTFPKYFEKFTNKWIEVACLWLVYTA